MNRALLVFLAALVLPLHAAPQDIAGKVVGVHDADRLTVLSVDKVQVHVRLEGIDSLGLKGG